MKMNRVITKRNETLANELTRMLALYAGQWLLRRGRNRKVGPLRLLSGGALLFVGATGRLPFEGLLRRANKNHGQVNCRVETRIQQPPALVYAYFHDLKNLKKHIPCAAAIEAPVAANEGWRVHLNILGMTCAWQIFVVKAEKNELIGWSAHEETFIYHTGKITIREGDLPQQSVVDFVFSYTPPGGKLGRALARPLDHVIQRYVDGFIRSVKLALEDRAYR
ncbi:hypothetical protein [Sphingobacterium suaedae]|uniref:Coenzyme Q-binding protein COQ10 START domain-containing protein n=1 Tax=Sphingobacterium suaedae TaxID=1686402 RepID=A0ABW5KL81_9SPHI